VNIEQINDLADQALDVAVRHIQDALGVDFGDLAGIVFADNRVRDLLADYIKAEIMEGIRQ
jgi:hypothetical protein